MPASQSQNSSISSRITGVFPAIPQADAPGTLRPDRAAAARTPSCQPMHPARATPTQSIPLHPSLTPQRHPLRSPHSHSARGCDESPVLSESINATHTQPHSHSHSHSHTPSRPSAVAPANVPLPPVMTHQDTALQAAARPKTDAALLEQMVTLRRAGKSLRQIGRQTGRCMESVRQSLLRYEQARAETPAYTAQDEDWQEPLRDPEPLPAGHPIATQAIWRGLERWRDVV